MSGASAPFLLVFPTLWDRRQLALRASPAEVVLDEPADEDVPWDFDFEAWLAQRVRRWRGRLTGVVTSSDYPGALAAAFLARALDLPGPDPAAVAASAHKLHARRVAAAVVPACTPAFAVVDPDARATWPRRYPVFVKPVRGSFSLFARRVESEDELARLFASPALAEYRRYSLALFGRMARRAGLAERVDLFLAEELLGGTQVTLEGFVQDGRVHTLGIVDTHVHPGRASFARFEYPSALFPGVQARIEDLAQRLVPALGLDDTPFNLELFHDAEHDRLGLIELNPRLCGQFADLYARVDGRHGYDVALALAAGARPPPRTAGPARVAASVPLRTFASARVERAPAPAELVRFHATHPGVLAWSECSAGQELTVAPDVEDGCSVRYAVLNLGAESRSDLLQKCASAERALGFVLRPSVPAPHQEAPAPGREQPAP